MEYVTPKSTEYYLAALTTDITNYDSVFSIRLITYFLYKFFTEIVLEVCRDYGVELEDDLILSEMLAAPDVLEIIDERTTDMRIAVIEQMEDILYEEVYINMGLVSFVHDLLGLANGIMHIRGVTSPEGNDFEHMYGGGLYRNGEFQYATVITDKESNCEKR